MVLLSLVLVQYDYRITEAIIIHTRHLFHHALLPSLKLPFWDFPSGPVVKNLPCNAGNMGLMPGLRTKIPHAAGQANPYEPQLLILDSRASELQLNPHIAATEANMPRADAQQLEKPPQSLHSAVRSSPHSPQLEKACMQQQRAHILQGRLSTAKIKKTTKHPPHHHHHFTPAFIRFPFSSYTES